MDEQGCPRCKTTKYRNPSLKLLVNVCGHSLCENCVEMLFIKGSGACLECGTALRRNNYRLQIFEDATVEKEMDIRKRILRDFNKKEEDFGSLRDYNDYLEMVETIIFNLVNGLDMESTRKMIEQYKKDNRDLIKKNQSKLSRDDEYLEELIDQQKQQTALRRQMETEEETREKTLKRKNKDALIDDLMFSDLPAHSIIASHKHSTTAVKEDDIKPTIATAFSTGIRLDQQTVFSASQGDEAKPYVYQPLQLLTIGPIYPTLPDILTKGYLQHVRAASEAELAGGFEAQTACQRALQDAFCGLFHFSVCLPQGPNSPSPSVSSTHSQGSVDSPLVT